jgi:hypothetical protein
MDILSIVLIVYGVFCLFVAVTKPPYIYNMKKFQIMEKMMGKNGLRGFVFIWGLAALIIGIMLR